MLDWMLCAGLVIVGYFVAGQLGSVLFSVAERAGDPHPGETAFAAFFLVVLGVGATVLVAYFTYFWARHGRTPGMRAFGLRMVRPSTGSRPRFARALARACLALLTVASLLTVLVLAVSDAPSGRYATADLAVLTGALAIIAASVLGHIWVALDRRRQSLQDKLVGVVILRAP